MLKRKYIQKLLIAMTGILLGFSGCDEPFKDTVFRVTTNLSAAEWIMGNPDFSDWVKVLERVDRLPAMNDGTKKSTFFVVRNQALNEYARSLSSGYNSILDLSDAQLSTFVKTHTIPGFAIMSKNMIGRVGHKTANGDFLTVAFDYDKALRYVNNGPTKTRSYIAEADVEAINGYIQVLDWPILTEHSTVWAELTSNENYSIFCDLVRQTGWYDQFLDNQDSVLLVGPGASPYASAEENESNVASGNWKEYSYTDMKTVLVIPNSVFLDEGYYDADSYRMEIFPDDTPNDPNSGFYAFIGYHIINRYMSYEDIVEFSKNPGGAGYLKQKYVFTKCESQSGIAIEDQDVAGIFLNPHSNPVQIDAVNRNIPASNGYIHEIDGYMYVPGSLPNYAQEVEFTDPIQFSAISFYREEKAANSTAENFYFYSGNIPGITWTSATSSAKVWYSSIFMPVSKTPELNRFKNFDGIFWDLGTEGTIIFDMPRFGRGNYDLWMESAVIPSIGGVSQIFWGDSDTRPANVNHMAQAKVENNTELVRIKDNAGYTSDRALRLKFVVAVVGQAGVDRVILVPRI